MIPHSAVDKAEEIPAWHIDGRFYNSTILSKSWYYFIIGCLTEYVGSLLDLTNKLWLFLRSSSSFSNSSSWKQSARKFPETFSTMAQTRWEGAIKLNYKLVCLCVCVCVCLKFQAVVNVKCLKPAAVHSHTHPHTHCFTQCQREDDVISRVHFPL